MEPSTVDPVADATQYRYERKFLVRGLPAPEMELMIRLHPRAFLEVYPPRRVNNIYFDSFDLRNYADTVDGLSRRVKIRIRWYGRLWGLIRNPVLELKMKTGFQVRKVSFSLESFSLQRRQRPLSIEEVFRHASIPAGLKLQLSLLRPTLLNRYKRRYFQSADRQYRITLDTGLEFRQITSRQQYHLHKSVDLSTPILELKYPPERDEEADQISRNFPFRLTKSSKYVAGIEALRLE